MIIWLIKAEESLPIEEGNVPGRMGALAQNLVDRGDTVIWWTSTFRHPTKTYRFDQYTEVDVSDHYKLCLLHSRVSYQQNMSLRRLRYYRVLARQMKKKVETMERPDLILSAWPAEQLCRVAIDYGKAHHVPVIVDARDMWPDIFERAFPERLRGLANVFLRPMKRKAAYVFRNADALCGMSPVALDWALDYAGREKTMLDQSIFIGNSRAEFSPEEWAAAMQQWTEMGITEETWNICLFSSLSKTALDMDTLIDAVRQVHEVYPQVRLIIGGTGGDEERLLGYTADLEYIHMMGWLNQIQMSSLMSISKVGMLNYRNTKDFKNGWGNKVGQYLSYGLPILTSAAGLPKTYVEQYSCGIAYEENNVQNLADVLVRLMEHLEEQKALSQHALERFQADFDQAVVSQQFEDMIQNVCTMFYGEKK